MRHRVFSVLVVLSMLCVSCSNESSGTRSRDGRGSRISCQIICDGMAGEFRDFDYAGSVDAAQSDCEETIENNPEEFGDQCSSDFVASKCSCFEEE